MKRNYFENVFTAEDAKKAYRTWAKKLHPDAGGNQDDFVEMGKQFESVWKRVKDIHTTQDGETYAKDTHEDIKEFRHVIDAVLNCDGVVVEIIGTYVWLTGNTYPYKDRIRKAGYWYSKHNKAWYWNGTGMHRKHYHTKMTMEDKREKFGSEVIGKGKTKFLPEK